MDSRWTPMALDAPRAATVALYGADVVPASIVAGVETPVFDLTPLVSRMRHSESELTLTLVWHDEMVGGVMPQPGQWLAARLNGQVLCVMLVDTISDYRLRSGERSMTVTARARDATSAWRDDPVSMPRYPQGTPLVSIAADVAFALGLEGAEVQLPGEPYGTPQQWYQPTNITAWDLVEQCLIVQGYQPFVDLIGQLRAYSRDILRPSDVTVAADRVVGFVGAKARSPIDRLVVKWRAPMPQKVSQSNQSLATTTVQAGYWKRSTTRDVYWSEDRTQQADLDPALTPANYTETLNSSLFVKNDINTGILPVGNQYFIPIYAEAPDGTRGGCIGGTIAVDMTHHRDDVISTLIGTQVGLAAIPDGVNIASMSTLPAGRIAQAINMGILFTLMARMGTGVYEIQGRPYDLVNPVNETMAFDPAGSSASRTEALETDLCATEAMAQAIATREFVFRSRQVSSFSLTIVDDPRIEVGDIIEVVNGQRLLVTGVQRDLSPGSSNVVELTGFAA